MKLKWRGGGKRGEWGRIGCEGWREGEGTKEPLDEEHGND
jgi:hypothetical protein